MTNFEKWVNQCELKHVQIRHLDSHEDAALYMTRQEIYVHHGRDLLPPLFHVWVDDKLITTTKYRQNAEALMAVIKKG